MILIIFDDYWKPRRSDCQFIKHLLLLMPGIRFRDDRIFDYDNDQIVLASISAPVGDCLSDY